MNAIVKREDKNRYRWIAASTLWSIRCNLRTRLDLYVGGLPTILRVGLGLATLGVFVIASISAGVTVGLLPIYPPASLLNARNSLSHRIQPRATPSLCCAVLYVSVLR